MDLLPLNKLGPHERTPGVVDFGLFLPLVSATHGYRLHVKIIHEKDQFLKNIHSLPFELQHSGDPVYSDYWSGQVDIASTPKPDPKSAWGELGRYIYRFALEKPGGDIIDWIVDPFAREFGVGKLSAFTLGYEPYNWGPDKNEATWKVPHVNDLIIYELMLNEFSGGIEGTIERLDYLADLGINCIEIMPVSEVTNIVDWGYMPNGYFGADERFGKRRDIQRLVHQAHQKKIAVILDAVYGHTHQDFPYSYVYKQLGIQDNPFMGPFGKDMFGASTDFQKKFTQDFFFTVNHFWLDCMHVDGFRYDCVPEYWDGAIGKGYANLVYNTFQAIKNKGPTEHWHRFFDGGSINLVQCAEQLECPEEIINSTYSNCTWQNSTLGEAGKVAHGDFGALERLGFCLGLAGYVEETNFNGDKIAKTALQYIENHDHSRFICNFGLIHSDNSLLDEGDRSLWYKLQPYLMGIFTAKGIPTLWQGQEFCENYYVPPSGWGRVKLFRPMRWDYFYDQPGKSIIWLLRKLIEIRRAGPQFRSGGHYFYNHYGNYQSKGILLFSRQTQERFSIIALNFTDVEQTVPLYFPFSGDYQEELHGSHHLHGVQQGVGYWLQIPSNYGRIWTIHK